MEKSKRALEEFAEESGTLIYGLSTVPDNWINQLKTYYNVKLEDGQTAAMWMATLALYLELLVARIDDILTPEEYEIVEKNAEEKILHYFKLVDFHGQKDADKKIKAVSDILSGIISEMRKEREEHGDTIPQTYIYSFIKSFSNIIPEELLTKYIKSKIELFEEQKFRDRLDNKLEFYK